MEEKCIDKKVKEETREILKKWLDETMKSQDNTYDKMTEYGWYSISNVETKEIAKTLKKVESGN